jgi:hypothetical protein
MRVLLRQRRGRERKKEEKANEKEGEQFSRDSNSIVAQRQRGTRAIVGYRACVNLELRLPTQKGPTCVYTRVASWQAGVQVTARS